MNMDWKDLILLYETTESEAIKRQLEEILKDAPPEILHGVKLKPVNDAITLWLENLKNMKEG